MAEQERHEKIEIDGRTLVRILRDIGRIGSVDIKSIAERQKLEPNVNIEDYLICNRGVPAEVIFAVRKAYRDTNDFGNVLRRHLDARGRITDKDRFEADLSRCIQEQTLARQTGKEPAYLGELMQKKGWISNSAEVDEILREQGMIDKAKEYIGGMNGKKSSVSGMPAWKKAVYGGLIAVGACTIGYHGISYLSDNMGSSSVKYDKNVPLEANVQSLAVWIDMVEKDKQGLSQEKLRIEMDNIGKYIELIKKNNPNMGADSPLAKKVETLEKKYNGLK